MLQIGLLLLTGPFHVVVETVSQYLRCANINIIKRLYVKLKPEFYDPYAKSEGANLKHLSELVPLIYNKASSICQNVDVRIILSDTIKRKTDIDDTDVAYKFDVVLTNWNEDLKTISNYVDSHFKKKCDNIVQLFPNNVKQSDDLDCSVETQSAEFPRYKTVCLGGTFDRLHNGHKVLLSEAALRATEKLIVGVTCGSMLKRKVLCELIEPVEKRISDVASFLTEVNPSIHYEVLPIKDPYGPTIKDPDINCIVVSAETRLGGENVNHKRKDLGMSELSMHIVDLVENTHKIPEGENKLSSSTRRMNLLGTCLKAPQGASNNMYTIFLQGRPLSGKSCISESFKKRGAIVINCDDLIQSILTEEKEKYKFLFKNSFCLSKDYKAIDYWKLIHQCLKDQERRQWCAANLHERVEAEIKLKIQTHEKKGDRLILIQDSLLLDDSLKCSEIDERWCTVITDTEVAQRLATYYDLTEEDATNAALSLPTNEKFVKASNRVFCSLWSAKTTDEQITKAWSDLRHKIQ